MDCKYIKADTGFRNLLHNILHTENVFKYFLGIQDRSEHLCDLGKLQETKYTFYQTRCNKLSNATQFAITYEMSSIFKFKTDVHKGLIHAG